MRRTLYMGVALLLGVAPPDAAAQGAVGLIAGLNNSSIKGDAPEGITWGGKSGFTIGLAGELRLTDDVNLLVQPTLTSRGSSLGVEVQGMEEPVDSGSVSLDYVSVPVLIKVMAASRRTFVTSGLDFGFLTGATLTEGSEESDVKDAVEDFDVAINFGFGGVVYAGNPNVTLELRYSQSLLNLSKGTEGDTQLPTRFRSSGFQFLAGVLLPLGGSR